MNWFLKTLLFSFILISCSSNDDLKDLNVKPCFYYSLSEKVDSVFLVKSLNKTNVDSLLIPIWWLDSTESEFNKGFRMLNKPLSFQVEIDGESIYVLKDRQHIGNMYNAVFFHLFKVDGLVYLGGFENIGHLAVDDKYLKREVDWDKRKVNVFVYENLYGDIRTKIGEYEFKLIDDSLLFNNINVADSNFTSFLISTKF